MPWPSCEKLTANWKQAAELCQSALEINPEMVEAYHRLAIIEAKQEMYEDSYATFTKALRLSPNNPQLLSDLGYALYLGDRFEMSEKALRKAIELNPNLAVAKSHLAMVLAESGQIEASDSARLLATADEADDPLDVDVDDEGLELDDASVTDLADDDADSQEAPETLPLELAAEQLGAATPEIETVAHQVKTTSGNRSKVQPARYVLEQSQETLVSDSDQLDSSRTNSTPHVEQAVYCELDDACGEDCRECAVSCTTGRCPVTVEERAPAEIAGTQKRFEPVGRPWRGDVAPEASPSANPREA